MRRILIILSTLVLAFCFSTKLSAKEYSLVDPQKDIITISTSYAAAEISIVNNDTSTYLSGFTVWGKKDLSLGAHPYTNQIKHNETITLDKGVVKNFTISGLVPDHKYYLQFYKFNTGSFNQVLDFSTKSTTPSPTACLNCQFKSSVSGSDIVTTLSGINPADSGNIKLIINKTTFNSSATCGATKPPICEYSETLLSKETLADGSLRWTLPLNKLVGETDYYFRAEGENKNELYISPVIKILTPKEVVNAQWPLTYSPHNDSAWISGQINNANPIDFSKTELQYSRLPFDNATSEALPAEATPVPAQRDEGANSTLGIAGDGKYGFKLTGLSPNTVYYVKQIIKSENNKRGAPEIKVDKFNSTIGYVPENSVDAKADYEKRSYKLLAPLPGLQVIFDQDLCREYVAEGKPVPGGDCDNQISNFINLLIKILIGLAAIVLVVQLIIQGYVYMVTDVPFLKAGAKSRFFDALFGLLLAMASYLILNTINPKLVSSTLSVNGVDINVEEENITSVGAGTNVGGSLVKIKTGSATSCSGGVVDIPSDIPKAHSGKICRDLLTKLYILKTKSNNWQVTSTTSGQHQSSCHANGNIKSGNCADIQMLSNPRQGYDNKTTKFTTGSTNPAWGELCVAIASISGLNYANEASTVTRCQEIKPYQTFKDTSGPHLHVNYIGG